MRNINANALNEINRVYGLEPITIVRVFWNDGPIDYSDKATDETVGKVLEISGLDNVASVDKSGASSSITVKLDDSDGSLRDIINNADVHKRPVKIMQWFADVPKSDAFTLFTGEINTPMEWNEGDRTFTFTVISRLENLEFGFSLEEGLFESLPVNVFGKPFPAVFGNVYKVPSLLIGDSPSGILAQGFAWVFDAQYKSQIADLTTKQNQALDLSKAAYTQSIELEILAASYNDGDIGVSGNTDDYQTYLQYHQQSQQAYQQSQQYADTYAQLNQELQAVQFDYNEKKAFDFKAVQIATTNFPRGIPVEVEINNTRFTARFDGTTMTLGEIVKPPNLPPTIFYMSKLETQPTYTKFATQPSQEKFRWFDAGAKIRVISVPMYYAACLGTNSVIAGVFARRDGVRILVPSSLYEILKVPFTNDLGATVTATIIQVNQPLTTLYDLNDEQLYDSDEIWCDIRGEVDGHFVPILMWTVANFTNLTVDETTASIVAAQTVNSPMNFAVVDRKNTIDFIRDIALQARVAVWVDNDKFKMRYLPVEPTATITITPDDVVENSLVVTCDDTEKLVTKLVADWRPSMDQNDPNKIIIRTNVQKYGLHEDTVDFYAFQDIEMVQRSAAYWSIRWGNTWKRIRLTTHIGKLALEAQDPVLLSGFNGLFSKNDVVGIVESCVFDSANLAMQLEIWLPIRWGEMTRYKFAFPSDVTDIYGLGALEFRTGNPWAQVRDVTGLLKKPTFVNIYAPPYPAGGFNVNDSSPGLTFDTQLTNLGINFSRPDGLSDANSRNDYTLTTLAAVTDQNADAKGIDIGVVTGVLGEGNTKYQVTSVTGIKRSVTQLQIAQGWTVVIGTPVVIVQRKALWYMQAPTWAPEQ